MKNLLFILLFFSLNAYPQSMFVVGGGEPGGGGIDTTEFYVRTGGDDSKHGNSNDSAWATIAKVNASSFDPGDVVYFKCGDTWRETLTVPDDSLTFMSYGTGDNPQILGSDQGLSFTNLTGNIWKTTNELLDPYAVSYGMEIWFHETDDSIKWGNPQETWTADFANLTEEYDWTWHGDTIYVYAASDPDTRYTSVEVGQRASNIDLNDQEYIEINGIDLFYGLAGVRGEYPVLGYTGLIVRNAHMAYFGIKNDEGYSIHTCYNNSLFEYDTIHDCGRRGISVRNYGDADVSNIVVQYCEFYNGFHTVGFDVNAGSEAANDGDLDSIIIRNCYIWERENRPASEGTAEWIWLQGPQDGTGILSGVYIYNNIMKFASLHGIGTDQVDNLNIFNNTFYGHNSTITGNTFHTSIASASTNVTIKNNIFYTLLGYDTNSSGVGIFSHPAQSYAAIDADYNLYYRTTGRIIEANDVKYYMYSIADIRTDLGWETNSPTPADPTFTSPPGNLHLQTGSPAIGAGLHIDWITTDYEGVARGTPPCIGAIETVEDP